MTSIVFVNRTGRVSGAEAVLLRLIEAAVRRGDRVRLVSPPGKLVDRLPDGVDHTAIDELDLGGNSGLRRLVALGELARRWVRAGAVIRRVRTDGDTVVVNSLAALPAARLARIPGGVSWLVHDTMSDSEQRALVRLSRRAVSRAVAVSPPTAAALRPLGVPAGFAPLGVSIPPARDAQPAGTPVIGIMGVLTDWKGHRVLLEALAALPGVRCEIAGAAFHADADYEAELRRMAEAPELAGRVRFLGHVDPLSTMRRWDVLVSASTSPEASPVVVLEAMSLGVPVIATDHGGTTWLLRDGAGVLVPPGDPVALAGAIDALVHSADRGAAMARSARDRVVADHDAASAYPAMLDALLGSTEGIVDDVVIPRNH